MISNLENVFCREVAAGLDFSDGDIFAACFPGVSGRNGTPLFAAEHYTPGISDKELAQILRRMWKKHRIPTRTVASSIHSKGLVVRYFRYENLLREELEGALRLEAEQALQLDPKEIVLDWHLSPSSDADSFSGVLVALPREVLKKQMRLIKLAGLYPVCVLPGCAVYTELFMNLKELPQEKPIALVNISRQCADIVVVSNRSVYPRVIFSSGSSWAENQNYLISNIQDVLLYYHLRVDDAPISKMVVSGYLPDGNLFVERVARETSMKVEVWDVLKDPRLGLPAVPAGGGVAAVGLGLRSNGYAIV